MPNWLPLLLALFATMPTARAEIVVHDDTGRLVRLAAPARRIVSLAPSITENLYAAGAGRYLVGAVDFSDYPEAAKKLPRVGDSSRLDLEAIVATKPDLLIAWGSGNPAAYLAKLKALGLPLFISEPRRLEDIATSIERFGELAGTTAVAIPAARGFRARLEAMRARYAGRPAVKSFYQIWNQPLVTVGGEQLIGAAMRLCGAENIFARLPQLAPTVSVEAVLAADPEAIVASGADESRPQWLDMWKRWRDLTATARGNLFFIPPDLISRPTPRILDGIGLLCRQMETARKRRPATGPGQAGTK